MHNFFGLDVFIEKKKKQNMKKMTLENKYKKIVADIHFILLFFLIATDILMVFSVVTF